MIQNHLTSQPLSKRLKDLGVPQISEFVWAHCICKGGCRRHEPWIQNDQSVKVPENAYYSAFLSSELGEMMKEHEIEIIWFEEERKWGCFQSCTGKETIYADTMAESMGLMLEYLILNGLIKI